jgi:hypothetical protein
MRREDESPAMERLYHEFGSMVGAAIFNFLRSGSVAREREGWGGLSREEKGKKGVSDGWRCRLSIFTLLYLTLLAFRRAYASYGTLHNFSMAPR